MSETKTPEVYRAINQVQAALAKQGISKDRRNQQQNYSFRGIDDVYNALSPLLAEYGLVILPRVLARNAVERETQKGGVLNFVTVDAEFDFVAASDGSKHTVRTFGEAMDSADKATNKAMSAAYKYAAFQAFAIPTEGEDNDADATTPPPVKPVTKEVPKRNVTPRKTDDADKMLVNDESGSPKTISGELWDTVVESSSTRNSPAGVDPAWVCYDFHCANGKTASTVDADLADKIQIGKNSFLVVTPGKKPGSFVLVSYDLDNQQGKDA